MPARLLAILMLTTIAAAAEEGPGETLDASGPLLSYLCDSGAELQLAEVMLETGETLVFLFFDGDEIQMRAVPAASGTRYRALDPETPLIWWSKGEEGFLAREADGESGMLETGCRLP
ncbi:MAG: MliC family protein [Parvibaculum sp.]|uniref:MliC family protein n=1 Tax=Parvibaculum sp. TaxID=2024848 RepID=UPI002715BE5D|nr:MliC family protein [Parvibaculum sp.]MDO8839035.1 MliC family protein [Parvibaculum sp.]